jgi:putative N6-adenine-specific DNA methylase
MTPTGDLDCLAVCAPGIEEHLAAELRALGVRRVHPVRGGVEASMRVRQLYAANLWCRTATRILVRVTTFGARTFAELERHAAVVDWERWIPPGAAVHLRVTAHRSQLMHTGAVAERLARAMGAPEADAEDPTAASFVVRVDRNRVMVSANASGDPLHHRPWRQHLGPAPLRPTLAAAVLGAIGWPGAPGAPSVPATGRLLLADPFCGSGTLAVEAALATLGQPPSAHRRFAFEQWDDFAPGTWASVTGAVSAPDAALIGRLAITVRDRDAGAAADAGANAELAGVASVVDAASAAVSAFSPSGDAPGADDIAWVVTNPPWGTRLGRSGDLRDLYATFGRVMRQRFAGWRVAMVVEDRHLAAHSGLPLHDVLHTTAGGRGIQVLATGVLDGTG